MSVFLSLVVIILIALYFLSRTYKAEDHSQYDEPKDPLMVKPGEISEGHNDVLKKLAEFHKNTSLNVADQRQRLEDLFYQEVDATITPVDVDGIPSEWVVAANADPARRLLYLHGGAFRAGSPRSHRYITAELSKRTGVAVLAIDYRMQPEFKIIRCHEDAQRAYRWILENGPNGPGKPGDLYVAGDSAGGNLTLSLLAFARDRGLPAVNAAVAFAPLADATMSSPTWASNQATDPFLGPSIGKLMKFPAGLVRLVQRSSGGAAPNDPLLSPLLGNLSGLPPTLIQASADEMLYGDAQRYANKARSQGSEVTLQLWPKLVHVFQGFGPDLTEAESALAHVADFIAANQTETDQAAATET